MATAAALSDVAQEDCAPTPAGMSETNTSDRMTTNMDASVASLAEGNNHGATNPLAGTTDPRQSATNQGRKDWGEKTKPTVGV
jgi:hypothetical protein